MKEGSRAGGGVTGRWTFDEEINYELEMDIELIVSRLEEPHIRHGYGGTASNSVCKTVFISKFYSHVSLMSIGKMSNN